ncbi:MAG: bacillithiol biosynthesis deacetylase BshB1 [Chitinophagaceae bacterium]
MKLDILALAAHPDDVELSCSGTLLIHAAQGKKVGVADLTQGELGTRGSAAIRLEEATAAAQVMGLSVRENIKLADGFFSNDRLHQLRLIEVIRKYQPEIILANALEDRHPDHGRAARLIADSCFLAGLKKIETIFEGKIQSPWRPRQVFHYIQDRYLHPQLVIDISLVMEKKIAAIKCYATQFLAPEQEDNQTYISTPDFFDSIIYRSRMMGKMIGVEYGEGFNSEKVPGVNNFFDLIL